jgi:integrase
MRRGEAIGLRWSDVDLEAGRLSVRRALIPINREVVVSEPKTAKGRRVVALDPGTIEVLKAQAARQLDEQHEWDEAWIETGLVFTAEHGAALDPESLSRYFRQAVKKTMLPQIRLHDLRHTHATLALQAGVHPQGRLRAPRPHHRLDHPGHLLARHPGDAGGGGGADRRAGGR